MKRIVFSVVFAVSTLFARADSPLTSTDFWQIYNFSCEQITFPMYKAYDNYGWGPEVMDNLCSDAFTIEQKLCLVNLVGWNINGQTHYEDLTTYYLALNNLKDRRKAFREMDGYMLAVFAYVKAMDDYFDVRVAGQLAAEAVKRVPTSRAVAMINGLIGAQLAMDHNWADVYRSCHNVEVDTTLDKDFCDAAIYAIMEYINLYKSDAE